MMEKIPAVPVNLNSFRSSPAGRETEDAFLRERAYLNEEMLSYIGGSFGAKAPSRWSIQINRRARGIVGMQFRG